MIASRQKEVSEIDNAQESKQFYIVLSQTGTVLSRLLHLVTKKEFNHSSISLNRELTRMYSFGRRNAYNPFWAGYVRESPYFGTFKRFPKTKIAVIELQTSAETYEQLTAHLEKLYEKHNKLRYDILGLLISAFGVRWRRKGYYYCSDFVKETLELCNVEGAKELDEIVHPVDFLTLPKTNVIYRGRLCDLPADL